MARTSIVRLALIISIFLEFSLQCFALDNNSTKSKRQIFREQVNPQAGGRIPEDAFRSDRLALNRLNKEGIAVPDGVVLEARHRESHYGSHRHDPDIQASIVKVVLGEDGRYAPPEGRYPFNSLVESTYVLRPPINTPVIAVPPRRPHLATLRLPARPFFQQDALNSVDQQIEYFNAFDPNFSGTGLWTGLLGPVPDVPNRLLRRQAKIPHDDIVAQNSNVDTKISGNNPSRGNSRDRELSDFHDQPTSRSLHEGRSLQIVKHPYRYTIRPTYTSFISSHDTPTKKHEDYDNGLVPVYLTPSGGLQKSQNYISYISPDTKFNFHPILPLVNLPLTPTPSYYYPIQSDQSTSKPLDKTVESRPHYVLDPPIKEEYNLQSEKPRIPLEQKNNLKSGEEEFQNVVQNPQVANALFKEHKNYDDRYQEITNHQYQGYPALEDSFPKLPESSHANQHPTDLKQNNILVPVALTHNNQPSEHHNHVKQDYNYIEQHSKPEQEENLKESPNPQNSQYQLIQSFGNVNSDYQNYNPSYQQNYNQPTSFENNPRENDQEHGGQYQNVNQIGNEPEQPPIPESFGHQNVSPVPNQEHFFHESVHQQDGRWHKASDNNLKIINQGNGLENGEVQYVRGGLKFEVVNDKSGVNQQSRGEVGQKKLPSLEQEQTNYKGTAQDLGSKHLNQVLHYIEPHEVVQQISTAPSIENEYPSLDTVPETSFLCQGPGRAMLPDPETSCQVFHLCGADGSKESFLCPKGARYDAHKQQCAPWTEVTCHA